MPSTGKNTAYKVKVNNHQMLQEQRKCYVRVQGEIRWQAGRYTRMYLAQV